MEQDFINEILQRLARIETKLDAVEKTKDDVADLKLEVVKLQQKDEQQQKIIEDMQDSDKWLKRAVIGAFITALVGVVFAIVKIGLGI